ncbi:MAG: Eco29kI family restriction endonuclease [Dehalococcoidia bacterium]
MRVEPAYNPLDKRNLGVSVADAMLQQPVVPLPPLERFMAAGIYAIYYIGNFPAYASIAERNRNDRHNQPIYVGKAVPAGARKGGLGIDVPASTVLYDRLAEHARSIEQVENLDLGDFSCRYLAVDDIWIPLGESLLIEQFSPVWNKIIDGYGNHDPGGGRCNQQRSPWDVLHQGRPWAERLQPNRRSEQEMLARLQAFLARGAPSDAPTLEE